MLFTQSEFENYKIKIVEFFLNVSDLDLVQGGFDWNKKLSPIFTLIIKRNGVHKKSPKSSASMKRMLGGFFWHIRELNNEMKIRNLNMLSVKIQLTDNKSVIFIL